MSHPPVAKIEWRLVDKRRVRLLVTPAEASSDTAYHLRLPIVFCHGLGCTGLVWEPTLKEIAARGLSVVSLAPDMPGYGRSEGPPNRRALNIIELAYWLARLLDHEQIPRVHLVGNSLGCQVAMAFARRYPHRVGAMVLQGGTTGTRHVPVWRYVTGIVVDTFIEPPLYCLRLAGMYLQMGLPRFAQTVGFMMNDDAFAVANQIQAPVLVVRGGKDMIVADKVARLLAATLPNGTYALLDHEAHAIEFNNPQMFANAMLNYLELAEGRLTS